MLLDLEEFKLVVKGHKAHPILCSILDMGHRLAWISIYNPIGTDTKTQDTANLILKGL